MREKLQMILVLVVTSVISAASLAAVNAYTAGRIEFNKEIKLQKSLLDIFDIEYDDTDINAIFEKNVTAKTYGDYVLYEYMPGKSRNEEGVEAVAFSLSGSGFWGPIKGIMALENDLLTIKGLKILEHSETPGLGGRMAEPEFQNQFKGKALGENFKIVSFGKAEGTNEVDAITGATETSKAVERLLRENINKFYSVVEDNNISIKPVNR